MLNRFVLILTLITNLFIISGVTRHWNNMSHQNDKMKASLTRFEFCNSNGKERELADGQAQEPEGRTNGSRESEVQ